MITAGEFRRTLEYVRTVEDEVGLNVCEDLERQIRGTQGGGAPRELKVDVLLTGLLLTADHKKTTCHEAVHLLLTTELSRHVQNTCGIRTAKGLVTVRKVRYLLGRITNLYEHTESRRPKMEPEERKEKAEALNRLLDALTGGTSKYLDPVRSLAVDASGIETSARGRESNEKLDAAETSRALAKNIRSADRDARWGYRSKTYDNKTKSVFGFQLIAHVRVGEPGVLGVPLLAEKIRVVPGNEKGVKETLEVLRGYHRAGTPIQEVLSDRGISYTVPDDWATPLHDLGITQVLDMHDSDRGARPHPTDGYVMIDGWPHVASIPDELIRIARPARLTVKKNTKNTTAAKRAARRKLMKKIQKFRKLIARRATYRFERIGKTSAGNYRYTTPARAGKMRCAGYPPSLHLPGDVPECVHQDGDIPKSCTQVTITVSAEVGIKLRQDKYWGSDEWIKSSSRRTRVEGKFGLVKSPKGGGVRRGWTHQVGLVKTSLMLAIVVTASNLRRLFAWAKQNNWTDDPLTLIDITDHGFVELDAHGQIVGGLPPPTA